MVVGFAASSIHIIQIEVQTRIMEGLPDPKSVKRRLKLSLNNIIKLSTSAGTSMSTY